MKQWLYIALCALASTALNASHWEQDISLDYQTARHGPDGALFLDPFFLPHLQHLEGLTVLDAGCGAGPWSIYAAQNGAHVTGVDFSTHMVELARQAAIEDALQDRIEILEGDVAALNLPGNTFDLALSINVGCNLPSESLRAHFFEMARVLRPGGRAIVTLPANQHILFTDGCQEILRGTLLETPSGLELTEERLAPGQPMWRKIPGIIVRSFYYEDEDYLEAAADAGFLIEECVRAHFASEEERLASGAPLGPAYVEHNPFTVLVLSK